MRAIKIDVRQRKVYEIEISGSLKSMYDAIECDCITHINIIKRKELLWLDDEGLIKGDPIGAFEIQYYPQVLSGNGLVLGITDDGENISTSLRVEDIEPLITFRETPDLPKPSFKIFSIK